MSAEWGVPESPAKPGTALIVGPVEPPIGGVSRYCRNLATLLARHGWKANVVDPARAANGASGLLSRGLRRVLGAGTARLAGLAFAGRRRLLLDNRQALWIDPASARGARLLLRRPHALFIHDGGFPDYVEALDARDRAWIGQALARLKAVVCMSDPIERAVQGLSPAAKTHRLQPLIDSAVDDSTIPDEVMAWLRRPGPVIASSGALHPHYGFEDLLAALERLRERGVVARALLLVGSFARDETVAAAVEAAGRRLGENGLLVLTDCPAGPAIIARCAAYVRPSRVDSFAIALHEAILAGVPVIAAAHPTRPRGIPTYTPGDTHALSWAIEGALQSTARETSGPLARELKASVAANEQATLDFVLGLG